MKKLFTTQTLYIKDGEMLEEVKERFGQLGYPILWGYVFEDYAEHEGVSHGFLHYENKMFFLSKHDDKKGIMLYEDFKTMKIEPKKPRSKTKKRYSENDLREAMEYGYDFGYQRGITDVLSEDDALSENEVKSFEEQGIFEDWLNDNNK